jgi:hypothetical protein
MRASTRHPRLSNAACRVYGVAIRLYPTAFRRAFGHELAVTFRNQLEDVLDSGGIVEWVGFAVHIAGDWIRTYITLLTQRASHGPVSLLGLADGDLASARPDRVTVNVSFVFAVLGVVVALVGWYAYLFHLPKYYL